MMRNSIAAAAVVALALPLWLVLTGFGGTKGPGGVTEPKQDYHAVVVDSDGNSLALSRFNVAGELSLAGKVGRGSLKVRLANITGIKFQGKPGDYTSATITLVDGSSVDLVLRDSLSFYGHTEMGLYQIRARDLDSIRIEH